MHFTKLEALGNDFLLIAESEARSVPDAGSLALRMCHRTKGAGADGLVVLWDSDAANADVGVRIFNADGSEAEVSGNGTRCVAAYLDWTGRWAQETDELRVATAAGTKRIRRIETSVFAMEMGMPSFRCGDVPFTGRAEDASGVAVSVDAHGRTWQATVSSVGNPHCSILVDDHDAVDWRSVGAEIERHPAFPNRVNVEFIRVVSRDVLDVRFWERGVGETSSSGTGASAACVAAIARGLVNRRVTVRTVAGELKVEWPDDDASMLLTGPARVVYQGEWHSVPRA